MDVYARLCILWTLTPLSPEPQRGAAPGIGTGLSFGRSALVASFRVLYGVVRVEPVGDRLREMRHSFGIAFLVWDCLSSAAPDRLQHADGVFGGLPQFLSLVLD
jgi:hypothetical protein